MLKEEVDEEDIAEVISNGQACLYQGCLKERFKSFSKWKKGQAQSCGAG